MMFKTVLIAIAVAGALLSAAPTAAFAQPPSPPQIVHRVDRDVKRAVTRADRAARHTARRTHHSVRAVTLPTRRHTVRALCNDGRVHIARTRTSACAAHGGVRR
jgi:hypothetical protein